MGRGDRQLLHQVYPTELHGDTVVLKPRGDAAGFTLHALSTELQHVRELILSGKVRNLLIDLDDHRYFGSQVIGDLLQLAQLVRGRGGRTGLCGVSDDMQSMLRLFQLEDQWDQYPTCQSGLHALAKVPLSERLWRLRSSAVAVALGVAIGLGWWFYPRPDYSRLYCAELREMWKDLSRKRHQVGLEEWSRLAKRSRKELQPIIDKLDEKVKRGDASRAEEHLLTATKFHWLPWLDDEPGFAQERRRQLTEFYLDLASAEMHGTSTPSPPAVAAMSSGGSAAPEDSAQGDDGTPANDQVVPVSGTVESEPIPVPTDTDGHSESDDGTHSL